MGIFKKVKKNNLQEVSIEGTRSYLKVGLENTGWGKILYFQQPNEAIRKRQREEEKERNIVCRSYARGNYESQWGIN